MSVFNGKNKLEWEGITAFSDFIIAILFGVYFFIAALAQRRLTPAVAAGAVPPWRPVPCWRRDCQAIKGTAALCLCRNPPPRDGASPLVVRIANVKCSFGTQAVTGLD